MGEGPNDALLCEEGRDSGPFSVCSVSFRIPKGRSNELAARFLVSSMEDLLNSPREDLYHGAFPCGEHSKRLNASAAAGAVQSSQRHSRPA